MSLSSAKEYFAQYLADDVIRPLNQELVAEVLRDRPISVFEFGCGQGKNLDLIVRSAYPHPRVSGIDISRKAVNSAHKKGRRYVDLGDEHTLTAKRSNSCSVAFTCSVLDHIEVDWIAEKIVKDLQRIARDSVILLETDRHSPMYYYYFHDYEQLGFTKLQWAYISSQHEGGDGSIYFMYRWEKKQKGEKEHRIKH